MSRLQLSGFGAWQAAYLTQPPLRRQAFERMMPFLGLQEDKGPNEDSEGHIARWLAARGILKPSPYCASFCSDILPAGAPKSAGAQALGKAYPVVSTPWFMDLAWYPTGQWEGHIYWVLGWNAKEHMTFEANTNDAIRIQRRLNLPGIKFARTPWPIGGNMPGVMLDVPLVSTKIYQLEGTR